jgi:hypothetical protein
MGIKSDDVFPLNPAYPSALNMVRKAVQTIAFGTTRAMTTATKVAVLPADATILGSKFFPTTASNAGTTATVTLTATYLATNTTVTLGTVDVKGTTNSSPVQGANYFNLERAPAATTSGDILIKATYAETGTPSNAGGPFYFTIDFVR